jgi:hypothetical protein
MTHDLLSRPADEGRRAGALFIAFVVAVQVPFGVLAAVFDYPDVLRRPAGEVLQAFAAGGDTLVLVWYAYAASIGLFAAAAWAFGRQAGGRGAVTVLALASAGLQAVALLRWSFAVPLLARQHAAADATLQAAIELQFSLLNSYLGVGLGEHLGQLLMVAWTLAMRAHTPGLARGGRWAGTVSAALLAAGLLEQLGTTLGRDAAALAPLSTAGFLLWSAWLVALGLWLVSRPARERVSEVSSSSRPSRPSA